MHEVLDNHLGGLSLPRKSVVSLTDRPDMTLDVYHGLKQQHNNSALDNRLGCTVNSKFCDQGQLSRHLCVLIFFAIFRNGNGRITMKGKGNLQILDLKPATDGDPGDGGSYVCRAENDIDSTDAEAELTVLGKYVKIQMEWQTVKTLIRLLL